AADGDEHYEFAARRRLLDGRPRRRIFRRLSSVDTRQSTALIFPETRLIPGDPATARGTDSSPDHTFGSFKVSSTTLSERSAMSCVLSVQPICSRFCS